MKLTVEQAGRPYIAIGVFIGTDEDDPQTITYISEHRNRKRRSAVRNAGNYTPSLRSAPNAGNA